MQRLEVGKARLVGVLSFVRKWPERDVVYFGIIKKGGRKKEKGEIISNYELILLFLLLFLEITYEGVILFRIVGWNKLLETLSFNNIERERIQ